ncbi:MAG: bifunctional demethylmenaquinone methyltransferase/2-methoxy-6-polyprenyl-1,4-benzoquinol methylase UbiE [Bacteroidota bacterium]|nr:bifunctional demethylmenaquinone methyltransferase/2-methoxy-6-polyprenyl-1,4-benzoquinol methylase UbiE [Bacteroidota bacterium]
MTKKAEVKNMFNNIALRYDLLNHVLSVGIDKIWRKRVIKILKSHNSKIILDVATGTGDLAIAEASLKPEKIIGVDIAVEMLQVADKKIVKKNLDSIISLQEGDSEILNFNDNYFDAITVAFGVRNFENLEKGLGEMCRVMNNNGVTVILEFSKPRIFPVKQFYNFYFKNILPFIGKIISKDDFAYTYLPESVKEFPDGQDFLNVLKKVGYKKVSAKPLTFGIATIYTAQK